MKSGWFDTVAFYKALDAQRAARKLTWKQVAAESKVAASTLTRMAQGRRPDVDGLAALSAWSGLKADDFVRAREGTRGTPETLAMISTLLRADPNLTSDGADYLDEVIQAGYKRMKKAE
jgi:transcriptional regulator with XRE-family HTH domain